MDNIFQNAAFMRHALDAVPSIVLVTDEDVRVLYRNQAGRKLLKGDRIYGNRAGDIMHCVHADDSRGGCGQDAHCADCLIRNSVNAAFSGEKTYRQRTDITVKTAVKTLNIPALISASMFNLGEKAYALMIIEDISELAELRSLLPICASCKKIRSEGDHWEKIETYIKCHIPSASLSHGICPECARKKYPSESD